MIRLRFLACAAALAAAFLSAQAGAQGRYVAQEANVARLQVGSTTAAQVEELIGAPLRKERDARSGLEVWEYQLWNFGDREGLWVSLSPDGVVREVFRTRLRQSLS